MSSLRVALSEYWTTIKRETHNVNEHHIATMKACQIYDKYISGVQFTQQQQQQRAHCEQLHQWAS